MTRDSKVLSNNTGGMLDKNVISWYSTLVIIASHLAIGVYTVAEFSALK